ncbi:MAG: ComEC/Rec2 family competence protein, partial [Clostridia bacterium]|nr:ComEC/Rec2 family competence protein [Clostridia bacterium]
MKENKIFNLRIMFLVFVCFIVGILTTVYYLTSVWFGLIILFLCLALIIFCYVRNKINFIIAIVCGVTIFLGCCAVVVERANFEHSASFENDIICGEIIYYSTDYSDYTNLIINNVEINNNKFNGNISIRYIGENLALNNPIGYKISFVADEYSKISYIENKEINNYFIKNDIKYEVLTSEIAIGKRKADLKIYLQDKIKENLILGIGNSNAELMFSAIFGDKSNLEDNTKEIFTASGVAHILAVSGLHVGLVVACLTFILKICRANKLTKFLI